MASENAITTSHIVEFKLLSRSNTFSRRALTGGNGRSRTPSTVPVDTDTVLWRTLELECKTYVSSLYVSVSGEYGCDRFSPADDKLDTQGISEFSGSTSGLRTMQLDQWNISAGQEGVERRQQFSRRRQKTEYPSA